jgi:DNA-binding MarR family transcriptional regulator/N-acetylglutamate synthase-like GNAT family acetyltransferase
MTLASMGALDEVRRFNRFYTSRIGVLDEGLLDSPFSLTEVRVLYEIAHRDGATAARLADDLGIDRGYLSRMLRRFETQGLLRRMASAEDGRARLLELSARGRRTFSALNARQESEIAALLAPLTPVQQQRMVSAMTEIQRVLDAPASATERSHWILRPPMPGDLGWVVHRHGALYAKEYGYDEHFEALVAEIVAEFVKNLDPARERCWIAERNGEIAGSVFLVRKSQTVAKLRLLYVEPTARGWGIGGRLVDECIRFARQAGYRRMTLWTQSELVSARRIYEGAGFKLVARKPHRSYGKDLVAETWELRL